MADIHHKHTTEIKFNDGEYNDLEVYEDLQAEVPCLVLKQDNDRIFIPLGERNEIAKIIHGSDSDS